METTASNAYPNKKKREKGTYLQDKKKGLWMEWDENGQVLKEDVF